MHMTILEYLRATNGVDPDPLRDHLHYDEALQLTTAHQQGRAVTQDLAINLYPGKWTRAVERSIRNGYDPSGWQFWHAARLYYLELGGEYFEGLQPIPKH